MKRIVIFLALARILAAQVTLTLTGPPAIYAGQTAVLTISLSGSAGQNLASMQWTLPASLNFSAPSAGLASLLASKAVSCNQGACSCVASGVNSYAYADGTVATIVLTAGTTLGTVSVPLSGLLGASTTATAVAIASGPTYSFLTVSPCDYNQDGSVNYVDVLALINAIQGNVACLATFTPGCSMNSLKAVATYARGSPCTLL